VVVDGRLFVDDLEVLPLEETDFYETREEKMRQCGFSLPFDGRKLNFIVFKTGFDVFEFGCLLDELDQRLVIGLRTSKAFEVFDFRKRKQIGLALTVEKVFAYKRVGV
jgi:hypothetical protein